MATVTITRVNSGFSNVPPRYYVGDHFTGESHLECLPVIYEIPEGYRMGKDFADQDCIVDPKGYVCDINHHKVSGRPALTSLGTTRRPALKKAAT